MNNKKKDFRLRLISLVAIAFVVALLAPVLIATPVSAATPIYVDAAQLDDTGDGQTPATAKKTIQAGIGVVDAGGTINVAAGTYQEQVVINKNLTLSGSGNPVIKAPASPTGYKFPEGAGNTWDPIVLAFGGTADGSFNITGTGQVTVSISGITVDGNARIPSATSRRAVGILYRNVLGGVTHCTVQNMGYSPTFGNSWGIMAFGTSDATFHGNIVSGYAKGGFVVNGVLADPSMSKPHAVIDGNTVTGPPYDPALKLAPNGIQIGWGATGSVTNNTVTYHGSPGTVWGGTGILIQSSPGVIVEGNTVTGNQDYGIATAGYTSYGGSYATGTIIRNNTVEGNGQGIRMEKMSVDTVVQNNTITGNKEGIHVGSAPLVYPIPPVGTVIHNNMIYSNTEYGLFVETDVLLPVDATDNWWGEISGPSGVGWGSGDKVSANVVFDPWLSAGGFSNTFTGRETEVTSSGPDTVSLPGTIASAVKTGSGTPTITVAEYSVNPGSVSFTGDIGNYIDVYVPVTTGTDQIEVRLYYTHSEVAGLGLSESSLRLYWWVWSYRYSGGTWAQCSDSGVDTGSNFIWARIRASGTTPDFTYLNGQGFGGGGSPQAATPMPRSVGGIAQFPVDGSGSSSTPYAVIIGGAMAALAALALGGWFARRRWLGRSS